MPNKGSARVSFDSSKTINEIFLNRSSKAKRIRFYRNGNQFFNGVVVPVSSDRYRSFDSLVTDLTDILKTKVTLQHGVQNIYSLEGRKVSAINQLEDGKAYVCSCKGEIFKKIVYTDLPVIKNWQISSGKMSTVIDNSTDNNSRTTCVKPRFIIVIRNGPKPRKIFRVFLNKRNALTMEQVLEVLTDSASLDTGAVRKIYNSSKQRVKKLEQIFDDLSESVFFVYGTEKHTHDDFKLTPQENSIVQTQKKMSRGPVMIG